MIVMESYKYCIIGYGNVGRFVGRVLVEENPLIISRRLNKGRISYTLIWKGKRDKVSLSTAGIEDDFYCENAFLTVKAYDVESIARKIKDKVRTLFFLQNGLGVYESLSSILGEDRVLAMLLTFGAKPCGESCTMVTDEGEFIIAYPRENLREKAEEILGLLASKMVKAVATDKMMEYIWQKALVNIGINPVTALTRKPNKFIVLNKETRETASAAVLEAWELASRKGIFLPRDPVSMMLSVARKTGDNLSSMLQDVLEGRRTEIDFLNGYVVREGQSIGLDMKVNKTLYNLVKALESKGSVSTIRKKLVEEDIGRLDGLEDT
jgi:2-dehydropantoate 2-reductase